MPPLRELAPQPTVSASKTATRAPDFASVRAADNPVKPLPITATSTLSGKGEGAGHVWVALAELPCGEHGHHGGGYAEPGVDGNDLRQREHGEGRVDCARDNDRKDGRAVARVNASESAREESVLGESEGHSRGGEDGAVEKRHVGDHGGEGEPGAEKGSADEPCGNRKVICVPVLPVAQCR